MIFQISLNDIKNIHYGEYRNFPFLPDEWLSAPLFEIQVSKDILDTLKTIKEKNIAGFIIFDKTNYSLNIINKKVCEKTFGTENVSCSLIWDREKDENAFIFCVDDDYSSQVEWSLKID